MRQQKTILRKAQSLENNALMAPAIYRLLTYVKWEKIPEKYKEFFDKGAEAVWNDDLKEFKEENILLDVDTEIKAIYKAIRNKYIIQALSLVPIMLADIYMLSYPISNYETELRKLTDKYIVNYELGKDTADNIAMLDLLDFLNVIITKTKLDIQKDLPKIHTDILDIYNNIIDKHKQYEEETNATNNEAAITQNPDL